MVGDNCTIYQGVTLGGVGLNKGKRHPTLGNNVTVGSGAKILGSFEVGDNCTIAANAVLLKPLESNVTAVGIPARPVKIDGVPLPKRESNLVTMDHYCKMEERVRELEEMLSKLQTELSSFREKEDSRQAEASLEEKKLRNRRLKAFYISGSPGMITKKSIMKHAPA